MPRTLGDSLRNYSTVRQHQRTRSAPGRTGQPPSRPLRFGGRVHGLLRQNSKCRIRMVPTPYTPPGACCRVSYEGFAPRTQPRRAAGRTGGRGERAVKHSRFPGPLSCGPPEAAARARATVPRGPQAPFRMPSFREFTVPKTPRFARPETADSTCRSYYSPPGVPRAWKHGYW